MRDKTKAKALIQRPLTGAGQHQAEQSATWNQKKKQVGTNKYINGGIRIYRFKMVRKRRPFPEADVRPTLSCHWGQIFDVCRRPNKDANEHSNRSYQSSQLALTEEHRWKQDYRNDAVQVDEETE